MPGCKLTVRSKCIALSLLRSHPSFEYKGATSDDLQMKKKREQTPYSRLVWLPGLGPDAIRARSYTGS